MRPLTPRAGKGGRAECQSPSHQAHGHRLIDAICGKPNLPGAAVRNVRCVTNQTDDAKRLELLTDTYKEVLDATKHQDDKIGRLFTGISFLTAGALALANLGSGQYLRQVYTGWKGWPPPAMLFLGAYLVLVVVSVMLLINSLATPLRVPGLSRLKQKPHVDWASGIKASQLYFGEISTLGMKEWEAKWKADVQELQTERSQALVGETHNLAVRTQFKYGRTSEATAVFNLALLSLSMTIVFCLTASTIAVAPEGSAATVARLPGWTRFVLGGVAAVFYFLQLQGQVRYSRQTMDELNGTENQQGAFLRYVWVTMASVWAFIIGSGLARSCPWSVLVYVIGAIGVYALFRGTYFQRRRRSAIESQEPDDGDAPKWLDWVGSTVALIIGAALTIFATVGGPNSHYAVGLGVVLIGAISLTALGFLSPTVSLFRNHKKFRARKDKGQSQPTKDSSADATRDSTTTQDVPEV